MKGRDNAEGFGGIVRKHQKAVFCIAYAKLGNAHDAEDVKQEVFIELWRNLNRLRSPEKVQSLLFAIAINKCKDHFRKNIRRERRETAFMESTIENQKHRQDDGIHDAVLQAVSSLPEKIRIVIMLKHLGQLSYQEISRTTGLSKTTIDGRLRTGKKLLRQRLEAEAK